MLKRHLFIAAIWTALFFWVLASLEKVVSVPRNETDSCMKIVAPHEGQSIPCSGPDGEPCVTIYADDTDCPGTITEVRFQWSASGSNPWYVIDDVIYPSGDYWEACWDNYGLVEDGDTVYFRVIAHDEYFLADTSSPVRVFVDFQALNAQLSIEDIFTNCYGIPKVAGFIGLKAVEDTMLDIHSVHFYYKLDSDPDVFQYWHGIGQGEPIFENVWFYWPFNTASLTQNVYYDFRAVSRDDAGNFMFDLDGDGAFDDDTFVPALAQGSGKRVFVDNEAPQPAISMVADSTASIYNINPSSLLGGNNKAYVKAGDDITSQISVLPSEDTCEVMTVAWFIKIDQNWVYLGSSTDPNHYPIIFNPLADELIPWYELEDGWWSGEFKAELHDSLGNPEEDIITLYILDVTPSQAVIVSPPNDSHVYGDVPMRVAALNPYEISEVNYQHKHQDSTEWRDILDGTSTEPDSFPIIWDIVNIPAGAYYLRAVAKDSSGIPDSDPPTIMVWVYFCGDANGDGVIDIEDVVYLINYLYRNGDSPNPVEAGDCNCDEIVDLGDVVYLINYLYRGGPPPGCP